MTRGDRSSTAGLHRPSSDVVRQPPPSRRTEHLLTHLKVTRSSRGAPRTRPNRVRADKAYSSRAIRTNCADAVSQRSSPNHRTRSLTANGLGRTVADHRLLTPQTTRAATSSNADSITPNNGEAWPPRYDKLAIVYRGAAVLRAITLWLIFLRHALGPTRIFTDCQRRASLTFG